MARTMARTLIEAVQRSDTSLAKKILSCKNYAYIDSQSDRRDGTALFWACCRGLVEIVNLLLAQNANVNTATAWGSTPLHAAADSNHCQIITILLRSGANVNIQTDAGDTPCHLAAYRGHGHAVQLLVEDGADVGIRNNRLHLAVHEADMGSHETIVNYLQAVSMLGREEIASHSKTISADWNCLDNCIRDGMDTKVDGRDSGLDVPDNLCDGSDTNTARDSVTITDESNSLTISSSHVPVSEDFIPTNELSLASMSLTDSNHLTFTNISV